MDDEKIGSLCLVRNCRENTENSLFAYYGETEKWQLFRVSVHELASPDVHYTDLLS